MLVGIIFLSEVGDGQDKRMGHISGPLEVYRNGADMERIGGEVWKVDLRV